MRFYREFQPYYEGKINYLIFNELWNIYYYMR